MKKLLLCFIAFVVGCVTKSEKEETESLFGTWTYKEQSDPKYFKLDTAKFLFEKNNLELRYDYEWDCSNGKVSPDGFEHSLCDSGLVMNTGPSWLGAYSMKGDTIFPAESDVALIIVKKNEKEIDIQIEKLLIPLEKQK